MIGIVGVNRIPIINCSDEIHPILSVNSAVIEYPPGFNKLGFKNLVFDSTPLPIKMILSNPFVKSIFALLLQKEVSDKENVLKLSVNTYYCKALIMA